MNKKPTSNRKAMNKKPASNHEFAWNGVEPNPSLADELYAISHFDPAQTDSTPHGPVGSASSPPEVIVDWGQLEEDGKILCAGPINIMTLASTSNAYMWQVGTDKVSYVDKNNWTRSDACTEEALVLHSEGSYGEISDDTFKDFGRLTVNDLQGNEDYEKKNSMDAKLEDCFGTDYSTRIHNGLYPLVSTDDETMKLHGLLYVKYGNFICGYKADNANSPTSISAAEYRLENPGEAIAEDSGLNEAIVGMSMTYDGYLIVVFLYGIGIIDSELKGCSNGGFNCYQSFNNDVNNDVNNDDFEDISNSIAVDVDENGRSGIYVASSSSTTGYLRKLVWDGEAEILHFQDQPGDGTGGSWTATYPTSGDEEPPVIKKGNGTGSTPTLMGFNDGDDKLVVITDGAKRMHLLAFWRNEIPDDWAEQIPDGWDPRMAGKIPVTCGLYDPDDSKLTAPEWIQTEQSVVVHGNSAFVVNNIPANAPNDPPESWFERSEKDNLILQVSLVGPVYRGPRGVECFKWENGGWTSKWTGSDIPSTSMVPIYSEPGNMVIVGGYNDDGDNGGYWQLVGLSWEGNNGNAEIVYKINLGNSNYGNGAYSIPQFLDNDTLIFNSIVGPTCIDLSQVGTC